MLGKTNSEGSYKEYTNTTSTPVESMPKNYKNYINFQGSSQAPARDAPRQPDHVAMYTLNPNAHPNIRRQGPNTPVSINRNPYLNAPIELRKDPPKQNISRYSNSKEQLPSRQSQELIRNKTEILKSGQKSNSISSKGLNGSLTHSMNKTTSQMSDYPVEVISNTYNQTVDLGSISRNQSIAQSITNSPEEELLKQKFNYLEFLEQSIRDFESNQDIRTLQNLNQSNRLLLLKYYEQINRQKEERSRKTISDCVSESDNMSEDAYSVDMRSDYTSLSIQSEKNKFIQGFSRPRDRSQEKENELTLQIKLNERLQKEYSQLLNANSQNTSNGELAKIQAAIKNIEAESGKLQLKNQEIKAKLNKFPFYQEWILMSDEAEGARKTGIRLREELKKRKERLLEIKQQGAKEPFNSEGLNSKKSQEARSKDKTEEQKQRLSSLSKITSNKPKMQPIPMPNRPLDSSQGDAAGNRVIQDSSLRIMGVSHQARNKSVNRSSNN